MPNSRRLVGGVRPRRDTYRGRCALLERRFCRRRISVKRAPPAKRYRIVDKRPVSGCDASATAAAAATPAAATGGSSNSGSSSFGGKELVGCSRSEVYAFVLAAVREVMQGRTHDSDSASVASTCEYDAA
eukprot:TRINITY_DN28837_c0_g2_i1.p2 TRINITY_DN28837_c0_g2~~TRINITY_DN28837_c0_g2_i1.p2  ORF type:complete len:130 (+),score=27.26 TRINITY_DN28837_c0_g2_i1:88-477(+)